MIAFEDKWKLVGLLAKIQYETNSICKAILVHQFFEYIRIGSIVSPYWNVRLQEVLRGCR